jgi:DNA invertase Pin-like site-specific DNA recombinase
MLHNKAMKIGYARVSTIDQNLSLQRDSLSADGCDQIFTDEGISGSVGKPPGLDQALAALAPGDTLVVWKLDRLGRSRAGADHGFLPFALLRAWFVERRSTIRKSA